MRRAYTRPACFLHLIMFLYCVINCFVVVESRVLPNKYRYSTNQHDTVAVLDTRVPNIYLQDNLVSSSSNHYRINKRGSEELEAIRSVLSSPDDVHQQLDDEDKMILDKFYQETRHQDPFQDHENFSSQSLWDEAQDRELSNALLDLNNQPKQNKVVNKVVELLEHNQKKEYNLEKPLDDWTIDSTLIEQAEKLASIDVESITSSSSSSPLSGIHNESSHSQIASYSPTIKLLTHYNPIDTTKPKIDLTKATTTTTITTSTKSHDGQQHRVKSRDRIVGATLYGHGAGDYGKYLIKPKLNSKSPVDAIKLHDELMEEPPKDGKVRVRMYFHRAIHDDLKLYGTGPWKYWGHGWGVEFGYDPKKGTKNDFYQKGYTIERAYGRDFCKDPKNCRPPDPEFFKSQQQQQEQQPVTNTLNISKRQ